MNGVHQVHEQHPFFVQATHEHARLHQAVEAIHHLLDAKQGTAIDCAAVHEVTAAIVALRHDLQAHFEREEQGGYLEEAMTRVPDLTPQANQLQKQHAEFLQLAERMVADAQCGDQPAGVWQRLLADYALFAKQLLAHEAAENRLLGRAFNENMSGDL